MFQRLKIMAAACAVLAFPSVAAAADDNPPFPRLAGVNISGPRNYEDPAYQAKLAKLNFSIVSIFPGWEGLHGPFEQTIRGIKNINPNTRIFNYHISMERTEESSAVAFASLRDKIERQKWWLYRSGAGGTRVLSEFAQQTDKPVFVVNTTIFAPKDSSGLRLFEHDARWVVDTYVKNTPSLDGIYEDNVFWRPRTDGDWNRDGVIEPKNSPQAGAWLRQGYKERFALLNKLMPGKLQIGNIADWGAPDANLTDLSGTLNGGIMEFMIGKNYSFETFSGWQGMMRAYRKMQAALLPPKLNIFSVGGAKNDYQLMRYGLASCLQDDAYYNYADTAKTFQDVVWFDEYNVKLGKAITPPSVTAWQKGVFRRDFENGIALVNPKGNGVVEVTLEEDFKRFSGTQAPSVNNGQVTRKVKLNDRDGIILVRTKSSSVPAAPELVMVD